MARPKAFDPEAVVEDAMDRFWSSGYEATSIDDLCDATGVGRQSLYNEFGDKRGLYLAALDRYASKQTEALDAIFARGGSARAVTAAVLDAQIAFSLRDPARGCMLQAATQERGSLDRAVAERAAASARSLERALTKMFAEARRTGEIASAHDPAALGRFFAATCRALTAVATTDPDRKHLASIARVALSVLD